MPELKESQLSNLEHVFEAANEFSRDAEIDITYPSLDKETVVLESGHQPNFLPHSGLWKKMFLLDHFRKRFEEKGRKAIAIFGFADYNLCTSRLLTQNKIPAFNKFGQEKFGFKIAEQDVWKRFDYLKKPDKKDWENTIGKIASHYAKYSVSSSAELRLIEVIEILEDCYAKAKNFPDLNAFFISRICNELAFNVNFFRYSDLQRKGVFIEQWEDILLNLKQYNGIYNNSIENQGLDIPLCNPDSLPFWYHCPCGAKVKLLLDAGHGKGECRVCAAKHEISFDRLEENFKDMSPNAVARNIIFSEGMGTSVFISGVGGGLAYGRISDDISRKLGFNLPVTISWKSRDYYIGPAHAAALNELARICRIEKENISIEDINMILKDKKNELEGRSSDAREKGDKKAGQKYDDMYKNIRNSVAIIKAVFATTPSFIDILVSQGVKKVNECWNHTTEEIGDDTVIIKGAAYDGEAFNIYRKMEELGL